MSLARDRSLGLARRKARRRTPRRVGPPAWVGYAFIAPNLAGLLVFTFVPIVFAVVVAFSSWTLVSGLSGIQFVGLANFSAILQDPDFWQSLELTGYYVIGSVPLTLAAGLAIALALNGPVPGRNVLRLIFFIPFVANSVAVSATWILLYSPQYGPIDQILRSLGLSNPPLWLASSQWAMPALIIMTIWSGAGYSALIYQAGLQNVPADLLEAATIDGAGVWSRFSHVVLPLLTPVTFLLVITNLISTSQTFGLVNLMTQGGPGRSTTVLSYYIYQNAFQFYHFGYAAALALAMFVVVLLLALVLWIGQRRLVFYDT